jgi:hypothetical protein
VEQRLLNHPDRMGGKTAIYRLGRSLYYRLTP